MPLIKTAAGSIFYAEKDDPLSKYPPLILIHGAGDTHLSWPAELRRLPGLRVISPDLPGHGRSSLPGRQNIVAYADSIQHLMISLGIDQAIILGHSMGGAISLTMSIVSPERVASLVLIGTGARLSVNPKILNIVREDFQAVVEMITKWQWGPNAPEQLRRLGQRQLSACDPEVLYGDYLACNQFDVTSQLSTIKVPTLILGGTLDKMTPLALSEELAAHIPKQTFVQIEGAGHKIPLEYPQLVSEHISQWISSL